MNESYCRILSILGEVGCWTEGRSLRREFNRGRWWVCRWPIASFYRLMAEMEEIGLVERRIETVQADGESLTRTFFRSAEVAKRKIPSSSLLERTRRMMRTLLAMVPEQYRRDEVKVGFDSDDPQVETSEVWVETPDGPITIKRRGEMLPVKQENN